MKKHPFFGIRIRIQNRHNLSTDRADAGIVISLVTVKPMPKKPKAYDTGLVNYWILSPSYPILYFSISSLIWYHIVFHYKWLNVYFIIINHC